MPRIKRWFPVSHDFLDDPQTIELIDRFGPRVVFMWLRMLSWADRSDGCLGTRDQVCHGFGRTLDPPHPNLAATRAAPVLDLMLTWGWVVANQGLMWIRNYAKYHITREQLKFPTGNKPCSPLPNLSEPDLIKIKIKRKYKNTSFAEPELSWPENWRWLHQFISNQNGAFPKDRFLIFSWWDDISYACGGLSKEFLETEFAKMRVWICDNPRREPTPKGYRRFVASWLQRAYERERRYINAKEQRR